MRARDINTLRSSTQDHFDRRGLSKHRERFLKHIDTRISRLLSRRSVDRLYRFKCSIGNRCFFDGYVEHTRARTYLSLRRESRENDFSLKVLGVGLSGASLFADAYAPRYRASISRRTTPDCITLRALRCAARVFATTPTTPLFFFCFFIFCRSAIEGSSNVEGMRIAFARKNLARSKCRLIRTGYLHCMCVAYLGVPYNNLVLSENHLCLG